MNMKLNHFIIIPLLLLLIGCNGREKELEAKLADTEQKLNDAVVEIQKLKEDNENLKTENDKLSKKLKARSISYKPPIEKKVEPKIEPKPILIGRDEIKSFLRECNSSANEIKRLLLELKNVDNQKIKTDKDFNKQYRENLRERQKDIRIQRRNQICSNVNIHSRELLSKITSKLGKIPNDKANAGYRQVISNVGQCINVVINCINLHQKTNLKTEMDSAINEALVALEKIENIANNY